MFLHCGKERIKKQTQIEYQVAQQGIEAMFVIMYPPRDNKLSNYVY